MPATSGSGQHRSSKTRGRVIKSLPAMAAVTIAGLTMQAAPAQAAPSQPGVIAPQESQPGVTGAPKTAPPAAPEERQYLPGYQPSPQVQQTPSRSYDDYLAGNQQSTYYQNTYYEAPAPQAAPSEAPPALQATPPPPPPVPTVQRTVIAPIDAPDGYFLVGGELVPYDPNIVDRNFVEQFNNTTQAIQADGGNWLVGNGFADAPRADRIAAGTATGVITGGAVGLAASMVPAAVITGTAAAIGGGLGVAATTGTGAIVWGGPVGWVFIPGAAALAGAGVGAALSAPIVLGLTGAGAVLGGVLGATVLGGEQQIIEEPAPLPAPESVPAPPAAPLTIDAPSVQKAVDQAVTDAQVWTEPAYEAVQGFTSTALEQPAVAETVAAVNNAAAPIVDQANAALAGLQAALVPA